MSILHILQSAVLYIFFLKFDGIVQDLTLIQISVTCLFLVGVQQMSQFFKIMHNHIRIGQLIPAQCCQ